MTSPEVNTNTARERAAQLENWIQQAQVTLDWHRRTGEPTEGAELVAFELAQAVLALRERVAAAEKEADNLEISLNTDRKRAKAAEERVAALEEALKEIVRREASPGYTSMAQLADIAREAVAGVPVAEEEQE